MENKEAILLRDEIVSLLKHNARLSIADIADQTGHSQSEIRQAIEALTESGSIVQYTTVVNEKKLTGIDRVRALIELEVRPEKRDGFDGIAARIFRHDAVIDHYLISGRYDFLVIVEADTLTDVSNFVANQLAPLDHIRAIATHFILKRYKVNGVALEAPRSGDRLPVSA